MKKRMAMIALAVICLAVKAALESGNAAPTKKEAAPVEEAPKAEEPNTEETKDAEPAPAESAPQA